MNKLSKEKIMLTPSQRVASRYMKQAKLFGLISNTINTQDLRRYKKQLEWMFNDPLTVVAYMKGKDFTIEASKGRSTAKIEGIRSDGANYSYNKVSLTIDRKLVIKTEDLKEVKTLIYKHFESKGLR